MNATHQDEILSNDRRIRNVLAVADSIAPSRATVLIRGESGTGKELLARYVHRKSPRGARRMIAINCAAVPEGLLESELFGFEKGAFTGAVQSKPGKFELANDSTLLLDEMSELPLHLQAKLLRVLQEGEVERLGAKQPQKVNFRLIATTNRDLRQMVKDGQFREDLYYRLNVIQLEIPPLRDRLSDVDMLAAHFVEVSSVLNGKPAKILGGGALQALRRHTWPGNVRELENVIERAVLLSQGSTIEISDLEINTQQEPSTSGLIPGMTVGEMEKILILRTLEYTNQNRTHAADLLGISIRTLRNKLQTYRKEGFL